MPNHGYQEIIEEIARRKSATVTVFADFCKMSACALAAGSREMEYLEVAKNYTRNELAAISRAFALLVQDMELAPFEDLLGPFYIECASHSSKQARGEFYTPPEISKLMARMLFDVDKVKSDAKPVTLNEPACGSGGMVLAVAELFAPDSVDLLRVTAQDINPVAADMSYINLTLWGIPARIILGNSIAMTVVCEWKNVHWHRVGEDQRQLFLRAMEIISAPEKQTAIDLGEIGKTTETKSGQFLFDL